MRKLSFRDPLVIQWLGFSLIAFAVLWAYSPSLLHIPRGDQIGYLAEVMHKNNLWDLTVGSYDLNRHRHFAPGDQLLFRPVVYYILGAEQFFFGNNFILWQLFGIIVHLAVIWQLLALLLSLRPGFGALAAAAFFALLSSNMEMVIWDHVSSYMVFLFCLLKILRLMRSESLRTVDWALMVGILFVMCFSHESGNLYSFVIFLWAWLRHPKQRKNAWLLLLPVISYLAVNAWNFWAVHGGIAPEAKSIMKFPLIKTFVNVMTMLGWWAFQGMFPSQVVWILGDRNMIDPKMSFPFPAFNWREPFVWVALAAFMMTTVLLFRRKVSEKNKDAHFLWIKSVVFLLLIFVLFITVGRSNPRGIEETIFKNVYYAYFFWLMAILIGFALLRGAVLQKKDKIIFVVLFCFLILHNGVLLYQSNQKQALLSNQTQVLFRTLNLLIASKKDEPDFSFYVAPDFPGNFKCLNVRRNAEDSQDVYSLVEILYPKYFRTQNPKYSFMTRALLN